MHLPPPAPDRVNYNVFSQDPFWFDGEAMMRARCVRRSLVDLKFRPDAALDWNYSSGVLTVELHQDLYWASGERETRSPTNVTATDWAEGAWTLGNPEGSGIQRIEANGSHTFRLYFDQAYREHRALANLGLFNTGVNSVFWSPWIDRYRDATSDDRRNAVIDEVRSLDLRSPHPATNAPFRLTGTTTDAFQLTLRDDEETTPRWVDEINFDTVEIVVREDITRQTQSFRDGRLPFAGSQPGEAGAAASAPRAFDPDIIDIAATFETETITLPRQYVFGCYALNLQTPPTSNVHFRRAVAYLLNRESHATRYTETDRLLTGFTTTIDEEQFVSASVLDTLRNGPHENYGPGSVMQARAREEMEAGGFEQDSDGNWLYQEGERAGTPIRIEAPAYPWMERIVDRAGPFEEAMASFGIDFTVVTESDRTLWPRLDDGDFEIALGYWGGRLPRWVFRRAFVVDTVGAITGEIGFPTVWEGPPVGEFATPPSAATDRATTYEPRQLIEELDVDDEGSRREITDRLVWAYNQSLCRLPVGHLPWIWTLNSGAWDWPLPIENRPGAWTDIPRRTVWQRGEVAAVSREP